MKTSAIFLIIYFCIYPIYGQESAEKVSNQHLNSQIKEAKAQIKSAIKLRDFETVSQSIADLESNLGKDSKNAYRKYSASLRLLRLIREENAVEISQVNANRIVKSLIKLAKENNSFNDAERAAIYTDIGYAYQYILFDEMEALIAYEQVLVFAPEHPGANKAINRLKQLHAHLNN